MSQSISRRSFLKCAGSGAVSLAAALLTGVCAAAAAASCGRALPCWTARRPWSCWAMPLRRTGVLVYLSVENLSAPCLPVGESYLQSRGCAP